MNIIKLLEQIEYIAEDLRFYGELTIDALEHELTTYKDTGFAAAMVCGYYSDQDGGEVSDEFYEQVQAHGGQRWDTSSLLRRLPRKDKL